VWKPWKKRKTSVEASTRPKIQREKIRELWGETASGFLGRGKQAETKGGGRCTENIGPQNTIQSLNAERITKEKKTRKGKRTPAKPMVWGEKLNRQGGKKRPLKAAMKGFQIKKS